MTIKRMAYLFLGWTCVALAALGVILPLLPTTPFLLVAAFAFSRSSRRFHHWLLNHKLFGPLVRDWQRNGVIRTNAKLLATVSMLLMVSISLYFVQPPLAVTSAILLSILAVLIFIWTRPSEPKKDEL